MQDPTEGENYIDETIMRHGKMIEPDERVLAMFARIDDGLVVVELTESEWLAATVGRQSG